MWKRKKKTDSMESIYEVVDDRGYYNLDTNVEAGLTDEQGSDTDENGPNSDMQSGDLVPASNRPQSLTEGRTSVHHDYERVDENIRIFDISRSHHIYDQPHSMDNTQVQLIVNSERASSSPHGRTHSQYEPVPSVDTIQQLPTTAGMSSAEDSPGGDYEQAPNVDISQINGSHILVTSSYERTQPHGGIPFAPLLSNATEDSYETAQAYERVPNVDIAQLVEATNHSGSHKIYERVPNVDITQLLESTDHYETAQTYDRVPNVDISQLLESTGHYERAQTYERVPNVDITQLLEATGHYERAQTYERVPNVDISQLLESTGHYERAQTYERVPNVDISQAEVTNVNTAKVPSIHGSTPTSGAISNKPTSDEPHCERDQAKQEPNSDIVPTATSAGLPVSGEEIYEQEPESAIMHS